MPCPTRRRRPLLPLIRRFPVVMLLLMATAAVAAATGADAPNKQQEKGDGLLGSLLGAVPGAGSFFADFWQLKPAVIQRRNPTFYHPILRSAELDTVLAFGQAGWKLVKRVRGPDGEWWSSSPPEPPAASTDEDDLVAAAVRRVERAHAAFDKGFSLVVDRLDEKHAGVGRLTAAVEAEVRHRVGANLYWTPGEGAQAFEAHFDWMVGCLTCVCLCRMDEKVDRESNLRLDWLLE